MLARRRLSDRSAGNVADSSTMTTPHALFAALTPTRRILAIEKIAVDISWPGSDVSGSFVAAVSDEYLGTVQALGQIAFSQDNALPINSLLQKYDIGGCLLIKRAESNSCGHFERLVANVCAAQTLPVALWEASSADDMNAACAAASCAAAFGTTEHDFGALGNDAPTEWELLDAMEGDVWEKYLKESFKQGATTPPAEILTALALGRFIGDVVGGWANTFG